MFYQVDLYVLPSGYICSTKWIYMFYQVNLYVLPSGYMCSTKWIYMFYQVDLYVLPSGSIYSRYTNGLALSYIVRANKCFTEEAV